MGKSWTTLYIQMYSKHTYHIIFQLSFEDMNLGQSLPTPPPELLAEPAPVVKIFHDSLNKCRMIIIQIQLSKARF